LWSYMRQHWWSNITFTHKVAKINCESIRNKYTKKYDWKKEIKFDDFLEIDVFSKTKNKNKNYVIITNFKVSYKYQKDLHAK